MNTEHEVLTSTPSQNRLVGGLPKIGIRPAIDGRRKGIRESLEAQTMGMAQAVAQFLSQNLFYSNGLPVELSRPSGAGCRPRSNQCPIIVQSRSNQPHLEVRPLLCGKVFKKSRFLRFGQVFVMIR